MTWFSPANFAPAPGPRSWSSTTRIISFRLSLCLLLLLISTTVEPVAIYGQDVQESAAPDTTKSFGWIAYPYIFYSPESNLAFGVGGMVYFRLSQDRSVNPSNITPSAYYSVNSQWDVTIIPEFYFGKSFYLYSYFSFGSYIDKYYGMGPTSSEIDNPEYEHNTAIIQLNLQPQLSDLIRAGLIFRTMDRTIKDPRQNPLLLSGEAPGADGGHSIGLGAVVALDSRDHEFYPSGGFLHEAKALFYSKALGSDYDYNRFELDLRWYASMSEGDRHVLALQAFGAFTTAYPPFYDLALLGGKAIMRGYYQGRYRDRHYIATQIEYRTRIWERVGIVMFAATGEVAERTKDFRLPLLQYSYGFGLRYVFDLAEKIDIRADVGFGKGTSGVYFDVQQAF